MCLQQLMTFGIRTLLCFELFLELEPPESQKKTSATKKSNYKMIQTFSGWVMSPHTHIHSRSIVSRSWLEDALGSTSGSIPVPVVALFSPSGLQLL